MFTAVCPHCSKIYKLDDALIGKRATCKQCRNVFELFDAQEIHDTTVQAFQNDSAFSLPTQSAAPKSSLNLKPKEPFAAETGLWNVGDLILGVYEVKPIAENIPYAEGGVGVVHRVYHREWDMDLAVKSPKPQFFQTEHGKQSYEQEAQTWIELGLHPNIVTCYLARRIGGIPRLFAEFVPDGSLRDWIVTGKLYHGGKDAALLRILNIAIQFAWGLDHAHRQSLLHLDVKPANVMMSDQTAKVSDFGLSQTASGSEQEESAEDDNYVTIGLTPGYCSPEQYLAVELVKEQKFDEVPKLTVQTDIWSWAVSIFSMFFGGPPCNKPGGQNARKVCAKFLSMPPNTMPAKANLPAVPEKVAELLMHCFEEEPAKRPESMEQIADRLIAIYKETAGSDFPRPRPVNTTWTPESMNNRAASLLDLNKPEEAAKLFNQAIAMQPWHPVVTYNKTILSWRLGQLTDIAALEQLETLVKMRPKESSALYGLGLAQREQGKIAAALETFSEALTMEDKDVVRRAIAAAEKHQADEARCLDVFSLADLPERKVYAEGKGANSKGEYMLLYTEPQTLALHSTVTGGLRRTFKIPDNFAPEQVVLSNDMQSELRLTTGGFTVRSIRNPSQVQTFLLINWGRHGSKQVLLPEQALFGSIAENRVDIGNLKTKKRIGSFRGHEDNVTALAFSSDGKYAVTAADDRTVRLWELPRCRCLRTFTTPKQAIDGVYLDPNGVFALSVSPSGTLRLWSVGILCKAKSYRAPLQLSHVTSAEEAGRQQTEMERLCNEIRQAIKHKEYGDALVWYGKAKKQEGWETARYQLELEGIGDQIKRHTLRKAFDSALSTHTLRGHQDTITSIAISLDANVIASAGEDGGLRVWNIAEQKCVADLEGHQDWVRSVMLTTDAKFLISGGRDGTVRLWNIATEQCIRQYSERNMLLTKIALHPQERIVAMADSAGIILLWDVLANSVVGRFAQKQGGIQGGINAIRFSRNGQYLASGDESGSVTIWKLNSDSPVHQFKDHKSGITAIVLSTDMSRCFSADKSGRIVIRNLKTEELQQSFQGQIEEISGLALSADARFLFSAAKDGSLKVWQVDKEPMVSTLIEGHPGAITSIALEISGRRLVTGCSDGVVRAWELLWDYEFPGWQPISSESRSVLRSLLSLYQDAGHPRANIDESVMSRILLEMGYCGFGTIPAAVLKQGIEELLGE